MKTWVKWGAIAYVLIIGLRSLIMYGGISTDEIVFGLPIAAGIGAALGLTLWAIWSTIRFIALSLWRLVSGGQQSIARGLAIGFTLCLLVIELYWLYIWWGIGGLVGGIMLAPSLFIFPFVFYWMTGDLIESLIYGGLLVASMVAYWVYERNKDIPPLPPVTGT